MFELLYVSTAVDIAPRIRPSRDSPSEILLINHPRRICKKTELSNSTSSPSFILKCSTVSVVPFTPELSRSDQLLTEETELPHKEFKETQPERLLEKKLNDVIVFKLILTHSSLFIILFIKIFNFVKIL